MDSQDPHELLKMDAFSLLATLKVEIKMNKLQINLIYVKIYFRTYIFDARIKQYNKVGGVLLNLKECP